MVANGVDHDVIVVGGGPTGLGLALELSMFDVDCLVLERHPSPQPIPKGQNLTQRTMEHFRRWGVEDQIRAARVLPPDYSNGGLTAYGTLLGKYWHPWYRRDSVSQYYHTANERLPQYCTEEVLRAAASDRAAIDYQVGITVDSVRPNFDGVTVSGLDGHGSRVTARARFVVGCDSNRSMVREQAAIRRNLSGTSKIMVLAVFRSAALAQLLSRYPETSFFNTLDPELDGYWRFLGRVDSDEGWFFHAPIGAETAIDDVDVARMLYDTVGQSFEFDLDHVGFWDAQVAIASSYRAGPVFVAGDSAHSHPPYGGFCINMGFEDARNLGWKLAATLGGWGGDELLDSYDAERRPVFESTSQDFIMRFVERDREFVRSFDPTLDRDAFEQEWERRASGGNAEVRAFAPHYRGSPIVMGGNDQVPSAVGTHELAVRVGCHLPPLVSADERPLIDRLGPGFTLLSSGGDAAVVDGFRQEAAARVLPLAVMDDLPVTVGEQYGSSLILVRPDLYVAWTDTTEHSSVSPGQVLDHAVGAR